MNINYANCATNQLEEVHPYVAGMPTRVINFKVHRMLKRELTALAAAKGVGLTDDFKESHRYSYVSAVVQPFCWDYAHVVSALITAVYSRDEMDAIVNNYMYEQTEEHTIEWNTMQAWRIEAKNIATSLFKA